MAEVDHFTDNAGHEQEITIKYVQPKIDNNHQCHMWYGGDVLEIEYGEYILVLCANGDVICTYTDKSTGSYAYVKDKSNAGNFYQYMRNYIKDDWQLLNYVLKSEYSDGALEILDSNCWEVFVHKGNELLCSYVLDSYDYDEAIEEIKDNIEFFCET